MFEEFGFGIGVPIDKTLWDDLHKENIMSLMKGDHLVIKRGDRVITPEDGEAYHEFEVLETPEQSTVATRDIKAGETIAMKDYQAVFNTGYIIKAKVVL